MATSNLDFEILKRTSCDRIVRILEEVPGTKDLVIDKDLMKLLDRIADAKLLRTHGVNKMFLLERLPPAIIESHLLYFMKPSLFNMKYVIDHFNELKKQFDLKVHIVCCPRIVSSINILLEEEGLYGSLILHEFTPEFIPLGDDLLTLEMHSFFKDAFIDGDLSGSLPIARTLHTLECLYGTFENVFGHGKAAQAVIKMLEHVRQETSKPINASKNQSSSQSQIGHLFIFDRDIDYVTTLLSQLTYEGAVDEFYGIKAGVVELPKEIVKSDHPSKIALNSKDSIFNSIRNRHFAGVADHLVRKAKYLQGKKQSTSNMTPSEIKDFISNDLRDMQLLQASLSLHISICEGINNSTRKDFDVQLTIEHGLVTNSLTTVEAKKYIEECVARQLPSSVSLRLLCLYSITQNGLSRKEYESLASQIFFSHGYHHMYAFIQLRQAGLLLIQNDSDDSNVTATNKQAQVIRQVVSSLGVRKPGSWHGIAKKLNLIPEEENIDLHNPTHISYVFNGAYSPLIPYLVSEGLSKGLNSIADMMKLFPGVTFTSSNSGHKSSSQVVIVLVLGGITFAEIAALRLISVLLNTKVIIASTCTTTGTSLIKSIIS